MIELQLNFRSSTGFTYFNNIVVQDETSMTRCFGPAMGHHQYWKASPVDTTLLAFGDHKEFVLKLELWGGHTLSHEECRCLTGPKLQEVTETYI